MVQQVVVHEMYFVVRSDLVQSIKELPRVGYPTLSDATRARNGRLEYEILAYYYLWEIITRNLNDQFISNI